MLRLNEKLAIEVLNGNYFGVLNAELLRLHKDLETCKVEDLKHLQGRASVINDMISLKVKANIEILRLKNK